MHDETMHGNAVHDPAEVVPVKLTPGQATRLGSSYIVAGVLLLATILFWCHR
jgi:hypothetical protein